jgi:hypothetical protein
MARPLLIACGLLALGCGLQAPAARADQEPGPGDPQREAAAAPVADPVAVDEPEPADDGERARSGSPLARTAAKLLSRSVWGVVPDAPARKSEVAPGMVRGSAVAVGPGTLLASCRAVAGRERIGLVRLNKYRFAQVDGSDPVTGVCVLSAPEAPLNLAAGFRSLGDLRPGEPVYALASRGVAEFDLAEGRMGELPGRGGWRFEAAVTLPTDVLSAVLFDGGGNLLGVGAPDAGGQTSVGPVTGLLAPGLANRDLGAAIVAPVAAAANTPLPASPPLGSDDLPPAARPAQAEPSSPAQARAKARLRATLTAPQGPRPRVRADERMTALLETSGDAYAYCYYADGAGRVSRIFPNRFQPDAWVGSGRAVAIPGTTAGFELAPDEPGTSEELSCLVAEREAGPELARSLGTADLVPLPVGSLDEVAAAFLAADGDVVEARLTFEVVAP